MDQFQKSEAPAIKDIILFVSRANLRPIIRQELKEQGMGKVHNAETITTCVELLNKFDKALLIIDYEHGQEIVNTALRAAKGKFQVDTRPIFLLSIEVSREVVAVGADYWVSRIHTGEISKANLGEHLKAVIADEEQGSGIREGLTNVAEARSRNDWALAGMTLSDIHERRPDDRRIACELANNFMHEERWEEAKTVLEQMTVVDSANLRADHLLARCYMKEGEFERASEILKRSKLLNPFNVDRLIDFGSTLLQLDLVKEALENFDEALEISPDSTVAQAGKGQCLLLEGEVNQALDFMRKMSSTRELASVFNNAAILCIHHGRFDQGLNLYQTAIGTIGQVDQMRSRLIFNMGLAHLKAQSLIEALSCFQKAFTVDPSFSKAEYNAKILEAKIKHQGEKVEPTKVVGEGVIDDFSEDFEDEPIAS